MTKSDISLIKPATSIITGFKKYIEEKHPETLDVPITLKEFCRWLKKTHNRNNSDTHLKNMTITISALAVEVYAQNNFPSRRAKEMASAIYKVYLSLKESLENLNIAITSSDKKEVLSKVWDDQIILLNALENYDNLYEYKDFTNWISQYSNVSLTAKETPLKTSIVRNEPTDGNKWLTEKKEKKTTGKNAKSGSEITDIAQNNKVMEKPKWIFVAGCIIGCIVLLSLFILILLSIFGYRVHPGDRFLIILYFSLGVGLAIGFLGGDASLKGKIPFMKGKNPLTVGITGGIAAVLIAMIFGFYFL